MFTKGMPMLGFNVALLSPFRIQEFLDWVVSTSEARVAAAGYRLGALLDGMLGGLEPIEPFTTAGVWERNLAHAVVGGRPAALLYSTIRHHIIPGMRLSLVAAL
jgi:hypothetical protein